MFAPRSMECSDSPARKIKTKCFINKPINQLGYRDKDIPLHGLKNKIKIIVLGDSFTEGQGLKTIAQRFSNLLENMLPPNYIVLNFGRGGSDTRDELNRLLKSPIKPDILILQYYINDIDYLIQPSAKELKKEIFSYKNANAMFTPIIRYSYICNFLYWKLYQQDPTVYLTARILAWSNKKTRETHLSDINSIITYCNENDISLIAVLFPLRTNYNLRIFKKTNDTFLSYIKKTNDTFLSYIEDLFREKNVPVLNLTKQLNSLPLDKSIVHRNDTHPSAFVNQLIAKELYMLLKIKNADQESK